MFPTKSILSLAYLVDAFWVVGVALWVVGAWTLVELARAAVRMRGPLALARAARIAAPWTVVAGLAAFVAVGTLDIDSAGASRMRSGWTSADVALVDRATAVIEHDVPAGGVWIVVAGPDFYTRTWTEEGIAYRLEAQGWLPGTIGPPLNYTGLHAPSGAPTYVVAISGTSLVGVTRRT